MATYRVFSDDFESYSLGTMPETKWSAEGSRAMPQVVDSAADEVTGPHGGTKMARLNTTTNSQPNDYENMIVDVSPLYTNEFFIRLYMRLDENMDLSTGTSGLHCLRFFQNPPYMEFLHSNGSPGNWIIDVYVDGTQIDNEFISIPSSASWHKFERYVNMTTGAIKEWVDDVLEINGTVTDWGGQRYNTFYTMSNHSSPVNDTNYMYIDDFEIFSDLQTGDEEATTGSMSDASIEVAEGGGSAIGERIISFGGARRRVRLT